MHASRRRPARRPLSRYRFGGSATAFSPLKFQQKMAYFKGKWQVDATRDSRQKPLRMMARSVLLILSLEQRLLSAKTISPVLALPRPAFYLCYDF